MRTLFLLLVITISLSQHAQNESLRKYVLAIEDSLNKGNGKILLNAIDYISIVDQFAFKENKYRKHNSNFIEHLNGSYHLGDVIVAQLKNGGYYNFHKLVEENGKWKAIFRLVPQGGGLNYHEYYFSQTNEKWSIDDIYIYLSGEKLSESLKKVYYQFLFQSDSTFKSKTEAYAYTKDLRTLSRAQLHFQTGNLELAKTTIDSIHGKLTSEKNYLIFKQIIYGKMDLMSYEAMSVVYKNLYPNDPSLNLILIDGYSTIGKYKEALGFIDQLDKHLHNDPYLGFYKANIHFLDGNIEECIKWSLDFHYNFPENLYGYYISINAYILQNDLPGCIQILNQLQQQFGYNKEQIHGTLQEYQYLLESEEYKYWLLN